MKRTLTFFCLLLFTNGLYAQKILFSQDFNSLPGYNITGWTHTFTGMVPWLAGQPYLVGDCIGPYMAITSITNKVAAIPDCGWDYNNSNVFMYSPAISLAADTGVWLSYDSYFAKYPSGSDTERATVEVSTDTGRTWTVVQDVPRNPSFASFTTHRVSLSAYNHAPHIWIGFRYSDGGGHMKGWSIDNIKVFVPSQKDIALTSLTPSDTMLSYVTLNTGYTHTGQVMNMGNDTITSFFIFYKHASGPIWGAYITGVSIPRFGTYDFIHGIPDTVRTAGLNNITVWAALIGDTTNYNDTIRTSLRGVYFMPKKHLLVEEGTTIQNGYCPKGWVQMNNIPSGLEVCKVSIHSGDTDAMALKYYDDFLYYLHWPNNAYIYVDRKYIQQDSLYNILNYQKDYFGFADLGLDPVINGDSLTMNVALKPAMDLHGDYRLAMVITEDNVTGTGPGYEQRNYYAGGLRGPMGGFESKPNPVPAVDMHYNFVARTVNPDPGGVGGIIPTSLVHNTVYNYTLGAHLSSSWQHNKMKAIVMLIRNDDSTVINSNETVWYLGVPTQQPATAIATIYPNPAGDYANLVFNLQTSQRLRIDIADITGKVLYRREDAYNAGENKVVLPVNNLVAGTYLVSLVSDESRSTIKLEVIR